MEKSLFGNRKRGLFKCNIPVILALAALVLLGTYIQREESIGVMSGSEPLEKKVAITFDAEVIIGLSQKNGCGDEAVL